MTGQLSVVVGQPGSTGAVSCPSSRAPLSRSASQRARRPCRGALSAQLQRPLITSSSHRTANHTTRGDALAATHGMSQTGGSQQQAQGPPLPGQPPAALPPFSSAVPTTRPHRYFREPWTVTVWDQARLFSVQLLCVGGSGALAKTAVAPLERIKILLQVQPVLSGLPPDQQYSGLLNALRRIPEREGGWRALFRGNGTNVARLLPEVGFRFAVHDQIKLMLAPPHGQPSSLADRLAPGAATGVLRSLLFHPLDVCRVRITADTGGAGTPRTYATLRQCASQTLSQEGMRGLYRGLGTTMVGVVPYLALSFAAYDSLKQALPSDKVSRGQWWYPVAKMGAGSAAAACAQVAVYPLDTLRRRLQVNGSQLCGMKYHGALDCVRTMLRTEGLSGFYRGCGVSCLRTAPGAAVQFVAYDFIKTSLALLDPTTGVSSPL